MSRPPYAADAAIPSAAPLPVAADGHGRARRLAPSLLLGAAVLLVSVALHLRDPHRTGSWGFCPWLLLTGTSCPGCGGLRAVNDLTHGDVLSAASSNLLVVASLPVAGWLWLRTVRQRWHGVARPLPRVAVTLASVAAVAVVLLFWVVRNVPAGAWLAP